MGIVAQVGLYVWASVAQVGFSRALRVSIGVYCADLSTSVKFDTEVDQSILISFFEGAKAGAHWGPHIS